MAVLKYAGPIIVSYVVTYGVSLCDVAILLLGVSLCDVAILLLGSRECVYQVFAESKK